MELAHRLNQKAKSIEGLEQKPYRAVAYALEAIPRTLAQNCGGNAVRLLTTLRAKHAEEGGANFGIDGNKGEIADMAQVNVWEPLIVKSQVYKTAIESSCMLLRIDDHVSGIKRPQEAGGPGQNPDGPDMETVSYFLLGFFLMISLSSYSPFYLIDALGCQLLALFTNFSNFFVIF